MMVTAKQSSACGCMHPWQHAAQKPANDCVRMLAKGFAKMTHHDNGQRLSKREMECISWVAKGKSSWDIGMILGISENTVNFHIKKVNIKLSSSNRTVSAIKAVVLGIIDFRNDRN
ncbi:MAG: LuxR family transcriptional regulator [Mesorhizobium sp.]|nr:MAG: LuxR family transcriptional regulator [Mesorhizobium sp.]